MESVAKLSEDFQKFCKDRGWTKFHIAKDIIISINIEAGELLEFAQWQCESTLDEALVKPEIRDKISSECADIFLYLLLLCAKMKVDPVRAAYDKLEQLHDRYPVDSTYGVAPYKYKVELSGIRSAQRVYDHGPVRKERG